VAAIKLSRIIYKRTVIRHQRTFWLQYEQLNVLWTNKAHRFRLHDVLIVWLWYRPDGLKQQACHYGKGKTMDGQRNKILSSKNTKTFISHLLEDDITDESDIDCETNSD